MKVAIIIPSRYSSERLPGKAIADIGGKPMVQWVYEACTKVSGAKQVIVATDHLKIKSAVESFGGEVMMTSKAHKSGTDRCAEVARKLDVDYVINVQGDEPFIDPGLIDDVIDELKMNPSIGILTCHHSFDNLNDIADPSKVKLVLSKSNRVLYFSRSVIPHARSSAEFDYKKHVGIYAFKKRVLMEVTDLSPSELEMKEGLEQLRWLDHEYLIHSLSVKGGIMGVDTEEDLERARIYAKNHY